LGLFEKRGRGIVLLRDLRERGKKEERERKEKESIEECKKKIHERERGIPAIKGIFRRCHRAPDSLPPNRLSFLRATSPIQ
jgi:hypothetical protein